MNDLRQAVGQTLALGFSLAKTNFKLRNEGSYLGLLWYILSPLALFAIILLVKNQVLVNGGAETPYYPVYLLLGILMFNLFVQTTSASIGAISSNANFVKSIKIPLESLVLSKVFQFIFSHLFELILLVAFLVHLGMPLMGILPYLLVLMLFLIFISGVSFLFATIGTFVSDLQNVWSVIAQLLFFMTPIFYIPSEGSILYKINLFNPLYYFIDLAQNVVFGGFAGPMSIWGIAAIISLLTYSIGFLFFNKYKRKFAEYV